MSFWVNMLSTFIGALLGFIFSLALYYLTNRWKRNTQKVNLEKNLLKEFEFNEQYIRKQLEEVKKVVEKVAVNDKRIFHYFNYMGYQRLFTQLYFQQGYLYEKLESEDINILDTILNHLSFGGEAYINETIKKWEQDMVAQQEIGRVLAFERDQLENYIKNLQNIKKKIISK